MEPYDEDDYPVCPQCNDYVMACVCWEVAMHRELYGSLDFNIHTRCFTPVIPIHRGRRTIVAHWCPACRQDVTSFKHIQNIRDYRNPNPTTEV